ncbi:MAG: hypothetical protein U0166_27720 [Acidobacteriota bacterium]
MVAVLLAAVLTTGPGAGEDAQERLVQALLLRKADAPRVLRGPFHREDPFAPEIVLDEESSLELMDLCEAKPEQLCYSVDQLAPTPEIVERVEMLWRTHGSLYGERGKEVKAWLVRNSQSFSAELLALANAADGLWEGAIGGTEALELLARRSWSDAEPLLARFAERADGYTKATALSLLYEHAVAAGDHESEAELRARLLAFVLAAPCELGPGADAIETLLKGRWEGQEEWLLSLLGSSLDEGSLTNVGYALEHQASERWVRFLARTAGEHDGVTRDAAVVGLGSFLETTYADDALRALLPWLADPSWSAAPTVFRRFALDALPGSSVAHDALPAIEGILRRDIETTDVRRSASSAIPTDGDPRTERALRILYGQAPEEVRTRYGLQGIETLLDGDALRLGESLERGTAPAREVDDFLRWRRLAPAMTAEAARGIDELGGAYSALAAVLLADHRRERDILDSGSTLERAMLLACARLAREPLPLDAVIAILPVPDRLLSAAAERYLEAEDSPRARDAIRADHPGELLVLGARESFDPRASPGLWDLIEDELREEVQQPDGPEEVVALMSGGIFAGPKVIVVRSGADGSTVSISDDPARWRTRPVARGDWQRLKSRLDALHADDLPNVDSTWTDQVSYEYVHITRGGGRRVYMYAPERVPEASAHRSVVRAIQRVAAGGTFETHYSMQATIPGLKVLANDPVHRVIDCWASGDDVRALVTWPDVTDAPRCALRDAPVEWHRVADGAISGAVAAPPGWPDADRFQTDKDGIWLCDPGKGRRLVAAGYYDQPLPVVDDRFLLARSASGGPLVSIEVTTGEIRTVSDCGWAVIDLPDRCRAVIGRCGDEGAPDDYALFDPTAGSTEPVTGDFRAIAGRIALRTGLPTPPFTRGLQPAGGSRLWTAFSPDDEDALGHGEEITVIARYDLATFTVDPVLTLPRIWLGSGTFWVDETTHNIYIAYAGDLLRVPLPARRADR